MKNFFVKNWIHFAVIAFFFILTFAYFTPQFNGYGVKQHDVEQFKGMAQETIMHREKTGEEPLWTNSMFGGMPTAQISVLYPGNFFQKSLMSFISFFDGPGAMVLLHLIGFYILALCLNLNPIVGVIGAIAVSFSTYEIVILQAGHNSKAITVALLAPTVGAFLMSYRKNLIWGVILSAVFMSYQLASNHLQVTYYLAILLVFLGVYELVKAIKAKQIKTFLITSGGILGAYLLALFINYGNITMTNDYAKHTIRGANDVTINPDGTDTKKNASTGLDKDYITNWSYGIGESFTLLSPYVKGSSTISLADSPFADYTERLDLGSEDIEAANNTPVYWGDQPMTSGPAFIGVIVIFLVLLGLLFLKDSIKWYLLVASVLCLMLSWGKNYMGLTDFFIDNVPGYNKFRTVTIILVIVEFCLPMIAVLFLNQFIKERENLKEKKKTFLYASAAMFVVLVGIRFVGLGDHYTSKSDLDQLTRYRSGMESQIAGMDPAQLLQQYQVDINNQQQVTQFIDAQMVNVNKGFDAIKLVRKEIFNSSMNTTILIFLFAFALMAILFYTSTSTMMVYAGLAVLLLIELIPVDRNYLNSDELDTGVYKLWEEKGKLRYPLNPEPADEEIMQMETMQNKSLSRTIQKAEQEAELKADDLEYVGEARQRLINSYRFSALNSATNYRVFDYSTGFGGSRVSYFHKSLGGYHGAKLRNIQNVYDFHLSRSNSKVYDMLNVKYFIQEGKLRPNPTAMGNAWLVRSVKKVKTPNAEILSLGSTFEIENTGKGQLLVNGVSSKKIIVQGSEKLQYLNGGSDTLDVPLPSGLAKGVEALFVMDASGKTNLIPAQSLQLDTANSYNQFVSIEVASEFNVNTEAIMLESEASKLTASHYSGNGSVKMTSYAPNKIKYSATVEDKQLIVFSEVYYKDGWKAYVDKKEVDICKVNYLLRGIEVPKGNHTIEFVFDLPKFRKSNIYATIGSFLILLMIAGGIWMDKKNKKELVQ
jgi:hypothetical protein